MLISSLLQEPIVNTSDEGVATFFKNLKSGAVEEVRSFVEQNGDFETDEISECCGFNGIGG